MDTTSVSSVSPAAQFVSRQLAIQQARRNAEQAEQYARSLRSQAQQAQREAGRMQEDARALSVKSDQALGDAGRARQGLTAVQSANEAVSRLSNIATHVVERQPAKLVDAPAPEAPVSTPAAPLINAQGQLTGTVISTVA